MSHVFISYVHEDSKIVLRLCEAFRAFDIEVWLDKDQLKPGMLWADAIRNGIGEGAFFIACFSNAYNNRLKTFMNEELTLAIDELRQRPTNQTWFIPVLLDNCEVPNRNIGAGETLRSLQWVRLYENWNDGIKQILSAIQPNAAKVHQLIRELADKSSRVRLKAADNLGLLGSLAEVAVPALVKTLDDENETVRAAAADALGKIGKVDEKVIAKLSAKIKLGGYPAKHSIQALAKLGKPGILALIQASNYDLAAKTLSALGKPAITPLLEALINNTIDTSTIDSILLQVEDPDAFPELTKALHHDTLSIRIVAAKALTLGLIRYSLRGVDTKPAKLEALSTLINGLDESDDDQTRKSIILALGQIREPASLIIPVLVEATNNRRLRSSAIDALGKIGTSTQEAIQTLVKALGDPEVEVRKDAVIALGKIGEPTEMIVPALVNVLEDSEVEVRKNALISLSEIGRPVEMIVPALVNVLEDSEAEVRKNAVIALGKIGEPAEIIIPALSKTLEDSEVEVRKNAVIALGKIGEPAEMIVPILVNALDDSKAVIRLYAVYVLNEIRRPVEMIIPALAKALEDSDLDVIKYAVVTLGEIGKPGSDAVSVLIEALRKPHFNRFMKIYVTEALGKIGDPASRPALLETLRDKYDMLRYSAANALNKLGQN